MSDELRLFATTDAIYPNIKEVSSDDIIADSGITTSYFVVTVPPNTLTANITPISGITYTHYVITVDDSDTPTFPADFTQGVVPLTKNLADWASEVWRLSVYDLPTTTGPTEITATDGTSGVTVSPNDTIGPDWTTGSFAIIANSGNPNSQIDYTIVAPTDAASGLAASATYDIAEYDGEIEVGIIKLGFTALTGTITVAPGTHNWRGHARDEAGNTTHSDLDSVTITGAGAGGTIGFTATSFGSADEEGDTIAITLERSGGTETATVTVSTIDDTSIAVTNYTAISSQTVTWTGSDNTNKTVNLTTSDQSSTYNNQAFIVIDYGSETGTETAISQDAARIIINSSNASGIAGYQQETSSGNDLLVMEAENYDLTVQGANSDTWAAIGPNSRYSPDGGNGLAINVPETSAHYGEHTELDPTAPYTEYDVNYTSSTTTAHVWIRAAQQTGSNGERIHITLVRDITSIGANDSGTGGAGFCKVTTTENHSYANSSVISLEGTTAHDGTYTITDASGSVFDIPNQGESSQGAIGHCLGDPSGTGLHHDGGQPTEIYTWQHVDENTTDRTLEFPATGAWKIRAYVREPNYEWDKIVLTTSGSYDPTEVGTVLENIASVDYYEGPDESSQIPGGGAPIDNPDNTVELPAPIPTGTTTAGVLVPTDGAIDVSTTTDITMTFANMTELVINSFSVTTGGSPVSGTLTSTTNSLRFSHAPLIEGNVYTVTINARIRDTDGDVKQVAIASPPWTFAIADPIAVNYLVYANFDGIATSKPHVMDAADMVTAHAPASPSSQAWNNGITQGRCVIVDDPAELNSQRGDVFRLEEPQNSYQPYNGQIELGSQKDELWHSFELYFPANYDFIYSWKVGFNFISPTLSANTDNRGYQVYLQVVIDGPTPNLPQCTNDGMIRIYRYDTQVTGRSWWGVTSNPSSAPNSCTSTTAPYQTIQRERWYRITTHAKMNDVGSDNGFAQLWVDGNLVIDKQTVRWRDSRDSGLGFSRVQPAMRHGGSDNLNFTPTQTQFSYWNNMILSDDTINP